MAKSFDRRMSIIPSQNFPTHGIWSRRIIARLLRDEYCLWWKSISSMFSPPPSPAVCLLSFASYFLSSVNYSIHFPLSLEGGGGRLLTFSPPPYLVLTIQTFQLHLRYSSTSLMVLVIFNPQEIRFKPLHCKNQGYEGFLYWDSRFFLFFYLFSKYYFLIAINC